MSCTKLWHTVYMTRTCTKHNVPKVVYKVMSHGKKRDSHVCPKCNAEKAADYVRRKKDDPGYKEKRAAQRLAYLPARRKEYSENREKHLKRSHAWRLANQEKVRNSSIKARSKPEVKEKRHAAFKAWCAKNPERIKELNTKFRLKNVDKLRETKRTPKYRATARAYETKKYATNPQYRIRRRLSSRLSGALKTQGVKKTYKIEELIGCSPQKLKEYIETQFKDGMTWESDIHIDHIKPCSSFDLTDPEQQKSCFHFTNLQPLYSIDNIKKYNHLNYVPGEALPLRIYEPKKPTTSKIEIDGLTEPDLK